MPEQPTWLRRAAGGEARGNSMAALCGNAPGRFPPFHLPSHLALPRCLVLTLKAGIVTSLVNCDDVVPRACMRSLAGFLEELACFDWRAAAEAAAQRGGDGNGVDVAQHLSRLVLWAVGSKEGGGANGRANGSGDGAANGSAEAADAAAEGLLHAAAHEMQAAVDGEEGAQGPRLLERLGSGGFQVGCCASCAWLESVGCGQGALTALPRRACCGCSHPEDA